MQVRKQHLELDMEQQTGSKQEKEYVKAIYCHPFEKWGLPIIRGANVHENGRCLVFLQKEQFWETQDGA